MIIRILITSCFLLFLQPLVTQAQTGQRDTGSTSTDELIRQNDSLIRQHQSYEDSMEKIRQELNNRNLEKLMHTYREREKKAEQRAVWYIVAGIGFGAILIIAVIRNLRQ